MIRDDFNEQLEVLRNKLNEIDHELISLLIKRFSITDEVGTLKSRFNKPIFEASREQNIKERIKAIVIESDQVIEHGAHLEKELTIQNADTIINVYETIFEESRKRQIR